MTQRDNNATQRAGMKPRDGFTLISVLVAVMLLSVGIMALAGSQLYAVRTARIESARTQTIQLLSAYAEEVRARDPWSLADEGPTAVDETGTPNGAGNFRRLLQVSDEGTQLLRARLSMWTLQGDTVRIETLIFKVVQ
jgi:type IV pilus assembly protein PilV